MTVSRKEFLARGLAAFSRELLAAARGDGATDPGQVEMADNGLLLIDNGRCLARQGGCFSCLDRCPPGAIGLAAGVGLVIDVDLCDGCGDCIAICPLEPKPIRLKRREAVTTTDGKGE
jgi:ferredoxin